MNTSNEQLVEDSNVSRPPSYTDNRRAVTNDSQERPVVPLRITFRNLTYTVPLKKPRRSLRQRLAFKRRKRETVQQPSNTASVVGAGASASSRPVAREKEILHDLNGVFREARLTAIMGSSGAGKTTLLNVLAGDVARDAKLGGHVFINSLETTGTRRMKDIAGFVFQEDLLLQTMTVKEAVRMSVLLRSPPQVTRDVQRERVRRALRMFRLSHAANTIVGAPDKKGISSGERKRTAIAMEVVINPALLFLDEPTSGLDTYTAFMTIKILHGLTRRGHTVVTTIHQPSSEIFHLFDDLLLLAHGRILYLGPASESVAYFSRLGYACPQYTNPADYFFMKVIQGTSRPA